ncbi:hypothetical protein [Altericista sp. CCNU0014]|uniref:hypothetical protein n=1 Tax=Altericista sp. CCNU0014 TaxID=3082949 RepID=UPI00384E0114
MPDILGIGSAFPEAEKRSPSPRFSLRGAIALYVGGLRAIVLSEAWVERGELVVWVRTFGAWRSRQLTNNQSFQSEWLKLEHKYPNPFYRYDPT